MRQMEQAYHYLKEKILDGTYKPAQKLFEREISEVIGVSRNTVKKALLKLERENLVELEENKGATIKSFALDEVVNYLEIRMALEGLVAQSAAAHISDEALQRLEDTLGKMAITLKDQKYDEYSSLNRVFHDIIYKSSKNQEAVQLINMIKTQLIRYQFRTILIPGRTTDSFAEHEAILNVLKARDGRKAEEAVKKHINSVLRTIVENYKLLI